MSGEIPSDGAYKPRSALGDVTNQLGKRGFSLISNSGVKSGDSCKKDERVRFAKKECQTIDDSKKENRNEEVVECVLRPHSCSEINVKKGNISDGVSMIACDIKDPCPPDVRENVTAASTVVKGGDVGGDVAGDVVSDNCPPIQLVHTIRSDENGTDVVVEAEEGERIDSAVVPQNELKGMAEDNVGVDDGIDASIDKLDSSKDEYADCSRFPESQESKCDLETCIGQTGDGLSSTCMDMIKACSCSFCTKAAYLWSDLHYQDIKGRIAAIKKSQKEATILVNRNSRDVTRNVEKFSNLESDLTGRWKSLFLHMEDIFVREGTQLERSLSTFKELIDNCKPDSEKS